MNKYIKQLSIPIMLLGLAACGGSDTPAPKLTEKQEDLKPVDQNQDKQSDEQNNTDSISKASQTQQGGSVLQKSSSGSYDLKAKVFVQSNNASSSNYKLTNSRILYVNTAN